MIFLEFVQLLVIIFLICELLIPAIRGTKFFPTLRGIPFRRKLVDVNTELEKETLLAEVRERQTELKKKTGDVVEVQNQIQAEEVRQVVQDKISELKQMRRKRKGGDKNETYIGH